MVNFLGLIDFDGLDLMVKLMLFVNCDDVDWFENVVLIVVFIWFVFMFF